MLLGALSQDHRPEVSLSIWEINLRASLHILTSGTQALVLGAEHTQYIRCPQMISAFGVSHGVRSGSLHCPASSLSNGAVFFVSDGGMFR